jgi:hypothetical protein
LRRCTLLHERSARAAKLGFWAESRFAVQDAQAIERLNAARGRFAIVEGSVQRVGESGGRTFLDFGRRYTQDFTIVVPRTAQSAFQAAGIDPKAMRGKRVRVRSVLYALAGPIEARLPAAIEIWSAGSARPPISSDSVAAAAFAAALGAAGCWASIPNASHRRLRPPATTLPPICPPISGTSISGWSPPMAAFIRRRHWRP